MLLEDQISALGKLAANGFEALLGDERARFVLRAIGDWRSVSFALVVEQECSRSCLVDRGSSEDLGVCDYTQADFTYLDVG